jgi:hypothetical protein
MDIHKRELISMILFEFIRFSARILHAHALIVPYPDPGSGLLLWQALGAIVTATLFRSRHMLLRFFYQVRPSPRSSADQTDEKRST